jgi:3-hydroxyacyl-[acyl-carrier-protein] dehydratase
MQSTNDKPVEAFGIDHILKLLPHRYPFLLVDRVISLVPGESVKAIKNVTFNEPFFTGHFPGRPVMPGVIILEALAQTAGLLAFRTANVVPDANTELYFVGIDKARFRRPVVPGDCVELEALFQRALKGIWKFETRALVNGVVVCSADMMVSPGQTA